MANTTEIQERQVWLSPTYGSVNWRGHYWNYYERRDLTNGKRETLLNEYVIQGRKSHGVEADTGIVVRHERNGRWTVRVDGVELADYATKTDAQIAVEAELLGIR